MLTKISPSENFPTSESPSFTPSFSATFCAKSGFEFAVKILISFPCVIICSAPYIKFIKDIGEHNVKFYDNQGNELDYPSCRIEDLNASTKKDSRYLQDSVYIEDGVHDGNYYFIYTTSGFDLYIDEYTYKQFIDNERFSAESTTTFLLMNYDQNYFAQVDTIDFMSADSYCNGKGVIY